jgi:hypothetical protein
MPNMREVDVNKNPASFGACCASDNLSKRTPKVWAESTCCISGIRLQVFFERTQALMLTTRTSSDRSDPHERNSNTHERHGV